MPNISLITHNIITTNKLDISLFSEISFQNLSIIEFAFNSLLGFAIVLFVIGLLELIFKFWDDMFS
jgi:hypothetical protein